jgi:hypothetical protein
MSVDKKYCAEWRMIQTILSCIVKKDPHNLTIVVMESYKLYQAVNLKVHQVRQGGVDDMQ